jgi:UDP-N-acetyl-D-glucosamine dehydrogenase
MPEYVIDLIMAALNERRRAVKGSTMLIMGVAYKRDVSDIRESPALDVINLLGKRGAKVLYHDPHVPEIRLDGGTLASSELTPKLLAGIDCLVVITDHSAFNWKWIHSRAKLIIDARNALGAAGIIDPGKIVKL